MHECMCVWGGGGERGSKHGMGRGLCAWCVCVRRGGCVHGCVGEERGGVHGMGVGVLGIGELEEVSELVCGCC